MNQIIPELDLKDKKILSEIEMNARTSHSSLAKKAGLSKQVVKYRLEKLEKEEIIQGYFALVDMARLGETPYIIYLKLTGISSQEEEKWVREVNKHPSVMGVAKNAGNWDLTIVIRAESNLEFDKIFKKIIGSKSDKIKKKLITSQVNSNYLDITLLYDSKHEEIKTGEVHEKIKIDEQDSLLISLLADNCRMSLLELGEKLKMSPNGVKNRIKSLESKEIIVGYKTKINYERLEYLHFRVFLFLKKFEDKTYKEIINFLKNKGNIESVSRCVGYADVDFRCYVKSIVELYELITQIKNQFLNNIIEIDSLITFGWESINYYK